MNYHCKIIFPSVTLLSRSPKNTPGLGGLVCFSFPCWCSDTVNFSNKKGKSWVKKKKISWHKVIFQEVYRECCLLCQRNFKWSTVVFPITCTEQTNDFTRASEWWDRIWWRSWELTCALSPGPQGAFWRVSLGQKPLPKHRDWKNPTKAWPIKIKNTWF